MEYSNIKLESRKSYIKKNFTLIKLLFPIYSSVLPSDAIRIKNNCVDFSTSTCLLTTLVNVASYINRNIVKSEEKKTTESKKKIQVI